MKIAILAPSPIPYNPGGIEKLAFGLYQAFQQYTCHNAEIIKIPVEERDFWGIIRSYWKFSKLSLNHFDLIISLKYPAWMVHHPHHIVYMAHRLRGLYDTYPGKSGFKAIWSENPFGADGLLSFPGPVIQYLVHYFDNRALKKSKAERLYRIERFFAISKTVAERKEYFPPNVTVEVVHPPSTLEGLHSKSYDYFLAVSRLDAPKRIHLIIQAMNYLKSATALKIVGSGLQEKYLHEIAQADPRIEFLEHASDADLVEIYAQAKAVIFVPDQEDHGFITLEAMRSKKPVITCTDSGGPLEFVVDGENGFICPPEPTQIAIRMEKLDKDISLCMKMGTAGYHKVKEITWENTVKKLLADYHWQKEFSFSLANSKKKEIKDRNVFEDLPFKKSSSKKKILVLSPNSVIPPLAGGQVRTFHLHRHLSRYFQITLLSFTQNSQDCCRCLVNEDFSEIQVPMSEEHLQAQWKLENEIGLPISDVALPRLASLTPLYKNLLVQLILRADAVICSHPYLYNLVRPLLRESQILIYDVHNVEYLLKKPLLDMEKMGNSQTGQRLLKDTFRIEQDLVYNSNYLFCISKEEADSLGKLYNLDKTSAPNRSKVILVPNATDPDLYSFLDKTESKAPRRAKLLFLGAWHPPNLEAVKFINDNLALQLPEADFVIIGSVKNQFEIAYPNYKIPENIKFLGELEEKNKIKEYITADIALNPIFSGSGSNLKMLEYMAVGLPIVSTPHGLRGIEAVDGQHVLIREAKEFINGIKEILEYPAKAKKLAFKARKLVEENYSWSKIAKQIYTFLEKDFFSKLKPVLTMEMEDQLGSGWYYLENKEDLNGLGKTFRWNIGKASFRMPIDLNSKKMILEILGSFTSGETIIKIAPVIDQIACGAPQNEIEIFRAKLEPRWQQITIDLPKGLNLYSYTITIECPEWSPAEVLGNLDPRRLGCTLAYAKIL